MWFFVILCHVELPSISSCMMAMHPPQNPPKQQTGCSQASRIHHLHCKANTCPRELQKACIPVPDCMGLLSTCAEILSSTHLRASPCLYQLETLSDWMNLPADYTTQKLRTCVLAIARAHSGRSRMYTQQGAGHDICRCMLPGLYKAFNVIVEIRNSQWHDHSVLLICRWETKSAISS